MLLSMCSHLSGTTKILSNWIYTSKDKADYRHSVPLACAYHHIHLMRGYHQPTVIVTPSVWPPAPAKFSGMLGIVRDMERT